MGSVTLPQRILMTLTLRMKLVLSSLALILLTIFSLGGFAYQTMKSQAWSAIRTESSNTAKAYSKGIGDWFADRQNAVKAMKEAIEYNPQLNLVSHLKQTLISGDFGLSYYGTREGVMQRNDPSLNKAGYDPRTRGWYQEALAAKKAITTVPYISKTMQKLVVTLAAPVIQDGEIIGVTASNLALDELIKDVLKISVQGNGYAVLLDVNHELIIAHPNDEMQLKSITELGQGFDSNSLKNELQDEGFFFSEQNGSKKVVSVTTIANTNWALALIMDQNTLEAPLWEMLMHIVLIAAAILIFVSLFTTWLVTHQLRGLNTVSDALEDIANGEGDLTVYIEVQSDDEVGKLAKSFNQFVSRLHSMASNLRKITLDLNHSAEDFAHATDQRRENISHQQDEISMVATAVTEMASATQEIANNAESSAKTAQEAVELSNKGNQIITQSRTSIGDLADEVNNAVAIIEALDGHSQKISSILSTIRSIAEQTNMLALNAAIEAARAGDQGRGFAVVADEVRVLSQRTHTSTEEIQTMIETLQSTTQQAVLAMSNSHTLAKTSVTDADQAGENIDCITNQINIISDMAAQIASAAEQQSSVTSEINRNTEGVQNVAEQMASDAVEAAEQAKHLKNLAASLEQEIQRYKL